MLTVTKGIKVSSYTSYIFLKKCIWGLKKHNMMYTVGKYSGRQDKLYIELRLFP